MPQLNKLFERYHGVGFTLLGVNLDGDARRARGLAESLGITYPILFDDEQKVSRRFDVETMPETVIIDRDGTVRHIHRGYHPGLEGKWQEEIRALLARSSHTVTSRGGARVRSCKARAGLGRGGVLAVRRAPDPSATPQIRALAPPQQERCESCGLSE